VEIFTALCITAIRLTASTHSRLNAVQERRHPTSRSKPYSSEKEDEEDFLAAMGGDCSGDRRRPQLQKEGVISCLSPAPKEFAIGSAWSYEDECAARVGRD
jgi:hypothetical protein